MFKHCWQFVRKTLPIENTTLVLAVAVGLLAGVIRLRESTDLATVVGIASCFSFAMGVWLAGYLCRLLIRGYKAWTEALKHRVDILKALLPTVSSTDEKNSGDTRPVAPITTRLIASCVHLIPPFCGMSIYYGLVTLFAARVEGWDYALYSVLGAIALLLLVVTTLAICLYLSYLNWEIASVRKDMEKAGMVPSDLARIPATADVLDMNVERVQLWMRLFAGPGSSRRMGQTTF